MVNLTEKEHLEWIQLKKEIGGNEDTSAYHKETFVEKLMRKTNENPLVPIGSLATLGALSYGLWCFRSGQSQKSQLMMRLRILAQGFTVAALVCGIGYTAVRDNKVSFFNEQPK